jgi:hypothetical protein
MSGLAFESTHNIDTRLEASAKPMAKFRSGRKFHAIKTSRSRTGGNPGQYDREPNENSVPTIVTAPPGRK